MVSVAHAAVVRPEKLDRLDSGAAYATRLLPVDRPGELIWDHPKIVRRAVEPHLIGTGDLQDTGGRGRPAELFRRRPEGT